MLIIFVKLSILYFCGSPGCASTWSLYVTNSSVLGVDPDLISDCVTDTVIFFFKTAITPCKALVSTINTTVFLSKIPEYMGSWRKSSSLVVAVVLDSRPFKFAWGKGLKKTFPSNTSKSGRRTEDINCQMLQD